MSRSGLIAAKEYSEELPTFGDFTEAERVLLQRRDATLESFMNDVGNWLGLDFSIDSLKVLEKWYIECGRPEAGGTGYSMNHAIGFYFGAVMCKTARYEWCVSEFPFRPGCYEVGVKRPLTTLMLTKGKQPRLERNKRMHSLWREAREYAL